MRRIALLATLCIALDGFRSPAEAQIVVAQVAPTPPSAAAPDPLTEVWAREETYWRLVGEGDVAGYLDLWHPAFRGWPCASAHPATKTTIADWVQEIRDKRLVFSYQLEREGGTVVDGVVVVYYWTPMIYRFPDGHTEGEGTRKKFTHTWVKSGGVWRIIGGMCGASAPR